MSHPKDSSKTPDFQKLGHEANQYPQFSLEQCRDLVTDMRRLQASNEYPASLGESDPLRIEWLIAQVESSESTRSRLVEALKLTVNRFEWHRDQLHKNSPDRDWIDVSLREARAALSAASQEGDA